MRDLPKRRPRLLPPSPRLWRRRLRTLRLSPLQALRRGRLPPTTWQRRTGPGPAAHLRLSAAFYTEEQARRGQRAFRQVCSDCHYTSEFKGPVFTDVWARRTARDLYRELRRTMPDDNPGGLPRQTYVDVMAYILELNGYPAGSDELPPDDQILDSFRLTPPEQDPGR